MAGLYAPLPTLRRRPRGRLRTDRERCGSLLLHRSGLSPHTPCQSPGALTRVAACTLPLSPIRDTLMGGFSHFVTSMTAPIASGWSESPGGACTHWKAPPCHGAPPLAAVALPAEIGVVDFDPSRQALCGVPLHYRLHQLVLDLPGGGLGDAKPAAQLYAGDAALALSEVVHGAKPSAQRHLGRRENRSGDHGCLPSTGGTLVKRAGLDDAVMLPCTNRAAKNGWAAPAHHRLPALILCSVTNRKLGLAEPLLKLHLVARHRSNPQKQPYVPVLYHTLDG